MELLVLFIIGLLITIVVLPFIALTKVNSAKRIIDGLVTRLSSLENEVHSLRRHTGPVPEPEAVVAAPRTFVASPPPPFTTPAPAAQEKKSVPPPIPEKFTKPAVAHTTVPARPPINWERFMGAQLFAWIGGRSPCSRRAVFVVNYI